MSFFFFSILFSGSLHKYYSQSNKKFVSDILGRLYKFFRRTFHDSYLKHLSYLKLSEKRHYCGSCWVYVKLKEGRVGGGGLNERRYLISFGASSSSYLFFSFLLIVSLTTRKRRASPTTTPQTAPAIIPIFWASVVQKISVLAGKLPAGVIWSGSSPH